MEHESYTTYQQAMALKSAGFDWKCKFYYDKDDASDDEAWFTNLNAEINHNGSNNPRICSAPTLAVAARWLREKYQFFIHVRPCIWYKHHIVFDAHWIWSSDNGLKDDRINDFDSYESALSAGIDEALKLINLEYESIER